VPVRQEIWLITRRRLADLVARIIGAVRGVCAIVRLIASAWWDQPLDRLRHALPALAGVDIEAKEAAFAP
jgi:hypothetical protein